MIIKISQTASNIKQSYDVEIGDIYFRGEAGRYTGYQPITLTGNDTEIKGVFKLSKLRNYIPFRYLFGKTNITRNFELFRDGVSCGNIAFLKHGYYSSYYAISLPDGERFNCYCTTQGRFAYISIYIGDVQVALVETFLSVEDFKFVHKMYLLDEYVRFADIFSFFVIYHAGFAYAQRFHMSSGSFRGYGWSISRYNSKYDPSWRETHFPDENFFGKINIFD